MEPVARSQSDVLGIPLLEGLGEGQVILATSEAGSVWRSLVHSYNLPPEQEVEQEHMQDPATLLMEQQCNQDIIQDKAQIDKNLKQAAIISFKRPIFYEELQPLYSSGLYSDTVIITKDRRQRRCHSFVLGASSSLMKSMFDDISSKVLDSDYGLIMPDYTDAEVDHVLRNIYGLESGSPRLDPFKVDFNEIDRINQREKVLRKPKIETVEKESVEENYLYSNYSEPQSYDDIKPVVKSKKKGRKKTRHGYLNDDFIDDEDEAYDDQDWDMSFNEDDDAPKQKKRRGRPKKIKEEEIEELQHYDDEEELEETILEPIIKVKEEEIERKYHEFNEFFAAASNMIVESKTSFNQDDLGMFRCEAPGCHFSTFVRASVQQHVRQSHSGIGYQPATFMCGRCGEHWANELYYSRHVATAECQTQERHYVCEDCGAGWYNLTNLTRHIEARECKVLSDSHARKTKCINCPMSFFSLKNRETHVRKAHMPPEEQHYRCAKCDMNFVSHREFNVHKKSIHMNETRLRFQCRIANCSFESDKREDLSYHVKLSHPQSVHICSDCGRNFADDQKLLQHLASHARSGRGRKCLPVSYNCPHCPREFNRKRHMELHVLFKHSQDRPFSCDQCGKKFKTRHCVNIHLRSHGIGGYSWCCEECGKTFNQISAYHVHLKVHSNVRDFACEDCGMTFKLKHSLKKHQLVHKAEFGHTCDFCGKKFKRSDNLINHRRRHTGEHPYKCDKCSWTGPDSSSFIHHKKKHAEPVHNVHQETKHGPFTNMSQAQGTIGNSHQDQKSQIQDMKPIVSLQGATVGADLLTGQPGQQAEIKLIHGLTKIQHNPL